MSDLDRRVEQPESQDDEEADQERTVAGQPGGGEAIGRMQNEKENCEKTEALAPIACRSKP